MAQKKLQRKESDICSPSAAGKVTLIAILFVKAGALVRTQDKAKLAGMKQSVGETCLTTFDCNEKIIIRQSILLYSVELLEKSPGPKQAKEL
jgi:hypothetical protein